MIEIHKHICIKSKFTHNNKKKTFLVTDYNSDRMSCLYWIYFTLFYWDSKSENSTCQVQIKEYSCDCINWNIWAMLYSGIRLLLHAKLAFCDYFEIWKRQFFKKSWIFSFSWSLFWKQWSVCNCPGGKLKLWKLVHLFFQSKAFFRACLQIQQCYLWGAGH